MKTPDEIAETYRLYKDLNIALYKNEENVDKLIVLDLTLEDLVLFIQSNELVRFRKGRRVT
jgi:hypothetical protein